MPRTVKKGGKENYEHFIPVEMKAIGAFMYGYQELAKYQEDRTAGMKRAWPIYDRFIRAVRSFQEAFDQRSIGTVKKTWAIAIYKANKQTIVSDANLTDKEIAESKRIYDSIMRWDEKALQSYVAECKKGIESYGFKPVEVVAPMEMEAPESAIESSLADAIEEPKPEKVKVQSALSAETTTVTPEPDGEVSKAPTMGTTLTPLVPVKKRGRKPKVAAV